MDGRHIRELAIEPGNISVRGATRQGMCLMSWEHVGGNAMTGNDLHCKALEIVLHLKCPSVEATPYYSNRSVIPKCGLEKIGLDINGLATDIAHPVTGGRLPRAEEASELLF
jgi:hypothetical protein